MCKWAYAAFSFASECVTALQFCYSLCNAIADAGIILRLHDTTGAKL